MALSTRRMSGMVAQAGPNGQALLDTLDAFRRKHVVQNKEIIHRNSDLMRNNTDLTKQLREAHNELIATRAENAALKAHNAQLLAQVRRLERRIQRLQSNGNSDAAHQKLQFLCSELDSVVLQIQHVQRTCQAEVFGTDQAMLPDSPIASAAGHIRPDGTTSLSRRTRAGSAGPQRTVSANPDLSLVSEGSHEPSLTASQKLGGIGYDEESDDDDDGFYYDHYIGTSDPQGARTAPVLSHSQRSRLSSIEPEDLADRIQDALVASPVRGSALRQKSATLSPTPSPPSTGRMEASIAGDGLDAVLDAAEDTIRHSRRRNSGVLPPPPQDVRQRSLSASTAQPSFLQDISVDPGTLDLSFANGRRNRTGSVSNGVGDSPSEDMGLSRTIRHSSSTSSLRATSASPELNKAAKTVASAVQMVARRKSTSNLAASSSNSPNILDQAFGAGTFSSNAKARNSKRASISDANTSRASTSGSAEPRKQLVAAMQGRPTGGPVSLTVPSTATGSSSSSTTQNRKSSTATVVTSVRKLSTSSGTKPPRPVSGQEATSSRPSARSRSTTPDLPPPATQADYTPILQDLERSEPVEQAAATIVTRVPRHAAPLTPIVLAGAAQAASTVKADKGKGKAATVDAGKKASHAVIITGSETSLDSTLTDSQTQSQRSSQSRSSAASPAGSAAPSKGSQETTEVAGGREGRRARSAVNYQEPSLTKKMRQPAGYVPSIKTVVSTRGVGGHGGSGSMGVRRKSSLEALGRGRGNYSNASESTASHRLESISDSDDDDLDIS